jgi:hypothetical protein
MQIAARGLELESFHRALAQQRQLHLRHRPLHAQKQPVVGAARVIDAVLVDDHAAHQGAELEQGVPVATIARQPRRLDGDDCADASAADRGEESLEAAPRYAASGDAQVVVDDDDLGPAERSRPIGQRVLPAPALMVVSQLVGRRLPDIDVGAAGEVLSADLAHDLSPCLRASSRLEPPPIEAGRAGPRVRRGAPAGSSAPVAPSHC